MRLNIVVAIISRLDTTVIYKQVLVCQLVFEHMYYATWQAVRYQSVIRSYKSLTSIGKEHYVWY